MLSLNGVVVSATDVAVCCVGFGVKVTVGVEAPKFVGVGEYELARDVEVRKEAPAVSVCRADTVPIPRAVGVGE